MNRQQFAAISRAQMRMSSTRRARRKANSGPWIVLGLDGEPLEAGLQGLRLDAGAVAVRASRSRTRPWCCG